VCDLFIQHFDRANQRDQFQLKQLNKINGYLQMFPMSREVKQLRSKISKIVNESLF